MPTNEEHTTPTMNFTWVSDFLTRRIASYPRLAGYYNHNYIVKHKGIYYVVRVPIPHSDSMDLRLISESVVLPFLAEQNFPAPRLLFRAADDSYYIHSYIPGTTVADIYNDRTSLPDWIASYLASQLYMLHNLDIRYLKTYYAGVATSPNTTEFFHNLVRHINGIYETYSPEFGQLYEKLKFPNNLFDKILESGGNLSSRSFVVCHCDIHRRNLILIQNHKALIILDWELVLVTDPIYDIAVHFHKMGYNSFQEDLFLQTYLRLAHRLDDLLLYQSQIEIYRRLEKIKSAIVDSVRYAKDLHQLPLTSAAQYDYAVRYGRKLMQAREVWGLHGSDMILDPARLLAILLAASPFD